MMPRISSIPQKTDLSLLADEKYDQYYETPSGKKFTLYFTNWGIYGRAFPPSKLAIDYIPELSYAFFDVKPNGDIASVDTWADFEKRFVSSPEGVEPLDNWNTNEAVYGCFGQFLKLKKQGKKFNLTLSLGGWTLSKYFSSAVLPENRINFINNIMNFLNKYPIFCGISLDWEYITSDGVNYGNGGNEVRLEDADNFRIFVQLLRQRLNSDNKSHYEIAVCCSARPEMAENMKAKELAPYISMFHIMTYDSADGSWGETTTAHHTNLKKTSYAKYSVEDAVDAYIKEGVPSTKIMIGVAFYSRGFSNTDGPGKPASGGSPDQSWEKGIVDYKDLPKPGAVEYWDPQALAPFSYDSARKVYNSYDNVNSVYEKCKYVWEKNLKGCLIWEASGDHPFNNSRSLTKALYDYLIKGDPRTMPAPALPPLFNQSTPNPTPTPTPTPNPIPPTPSPTPTPTPTPIPLPPVGVRPWADNTSYNIGDLVTSAGKVYSCLQAHRSNIGWKPELTTDILWKISNLPPPQPTPTPVPVPTPTPVPVPVPTPVPTPTPVPVPTPTPTPTPMPVPTPKPKPDHCDYCHRKIKSIKFSTNVDFSNIEFIYEDETN